MRSRVRMTTAAVGLAALGWAALVGVGLWFDADWPDDREGWQVVATVGALITAFGVTSWLILARQDRLDWLARTMVACLTAVIVWFALGLGAVVYPGRLTFGPNAVRALEAWLTLGALAFLVALLWTLDPSSVPSARTIARRTLLWLLYGALVAGSVWGAGEWL